MLGRHSITCSEKHPSLQAMFYKACFDRITAFRYTSYMKLRSGKRRGTSLILQGIVDWRVAYQVTRLHSWPYAVIMSFPDRQESNGHNRYYLLQRNDLRFLCTFGTGTAMSIAIGLYMVWDIRK